MFPEHVPVERIGRFGNLAVVMPPPALIAGRMAAVFNARDWELLEAIARLAETDAPIEMAASDPAMFATLRSAITRFHLKGCRR